MNTASVVVLGGTGFVGCRLASALVGAEYRVIVPSRNRDARREVSVLPGVQTLNCDVYDSAALAQVCAGASAVVNLVGILNEKGRDGRGFQRAHVELTQGVIAACRQAGVKRLLQMSALNAGKGNSHYLRTRGEAEQLVQASGLDWTIFQPSVIFGQNDGLFFRFAGLLKIWEVIPLGRANARFAPVFVGDVAQAMLTALRNPDTIGKRYQLGGPEVLSLREIVERTARWLQLRRWIIPLPDALAALQAAMLEWIPGKPLSMDNYRSLQLDSVPSEDGLAALGITKTPIETVIPGLLARSPRQLRLDANRLVR